MGEQAETPIGKCIQALRAQQQGARETVANVDSILNRVAYRDAQPSNPEAKEEAVKDPQNLTESLERLVIDGQKIVESLSKLENRVNKLF